MINTGMEAGKYKGLIQLQRRDLAQSSGNLGLLDYYGGNSFTFYVVSTQNLPSMEDVMTEINISCKRK